MLLVGIMFLWLLKVNHNLVNSAIGLEGDQITLRDHTGREGRYAVRDVIYSDIAVAAPDMAVFLGQNQMAVYDRQTLDTQLFPRLTEARSVPAWEMQKALLRMRHPQSLVLIAAFVSVLAAGMWLIIREMT